MHRTRRAGAACLLALAVSVAGAEEAAFEAEAYHAWMDDAGMLKKRGLAKRMKRSLEAALAIDPEHVEARRELADFYHYAPWIVGGDEDKADSHEKAYYYRARASAMATLELDRGLECARYYVEHCIDCDDSDRSYGWWRQATILKRQGKISAAIAAYHEALQLNPELEGARKGLGELER